MILTGKPSMRPHIFIYFSCYFDIDQGHSSSKQIEKENKPQRKVIGLDNVIKVRFKWSEKGSGKSYILTDVVCGERVGERQ